MIVRILGEGQWEVPDSAIADLNALDDQVAQQARAARLKDAFGAVVFLAVGRVLQGLGIAPHGKPMDVETQGFQRRNLTPDEAVRGAGVGVDEIADSQGCKPLSNTRGTQKRRFKLVSA